MASASSRRAPTRPAISTARRRTGSASSYRPRRHRYQPETFSANASSRLSPEGSSRRIAASARSCVSWSLPSWNTILASSAWAHPAPSSSPASSASARYRRHATSFSIVVAAAKRRLGVEARGGEPLCQRSAHDVGEPQRLADTTTTASACSHNVMARSPAIRDQRYAATLCLAASLTGVAELLQVSKRLPVMRGDQQRDLVGAVAGPLGGPLRDLRVLAGAERLRQASRTHRRGSADAGTRTRARRRSSTARAERSAP